MTSRPRHSDATRAAIVAAAGTDETYGSIAARFGTTTEYVRKLARDAGAPPRRGGRGGGSTPEQRAARDAAIHDAFAAGEASIVGLAEAHGLSVTTVSKIFLDERRRRAREAGRLAVISALDLDRLALPSTTSRLVPTRVVAMSPFGPDVEHADPAKAAAERAPLWGGRYPRSPSPSLSAMGSPAGLCVEAG